MRTKLYLTLLLLAGTVIPTIAQTSQQANAQTGQVVAFVNVNVVPMDSQRVVSGQTVIVRDGRISEVGPADKTKPPAGALEIDGRGKYLLPGLVDMHVGIPPGEGKVADGAGRVMYLLLANGITTARSMAGHPSHLQIRDRISKGELLGPTIYAGGPPLQGHVITTPELARQTVMEQKKAGFDFIRVIVGFPPGVYDSIIAAAKEAQMPVTGNVDPDIGLKRALEARQQIDQLDSYLEAILRDNAPVKRSRTPTDPGRILVELDEAKIPGVAAAIREAGIWNTPTLALFKRVASEQTGPQMAQQPEMRYIAQQAKLAWLQQRGWLDADPPSPEERKRLVDIRNKITKALYEAGAKLLAGSNSPRDFQVPGFALHDELRSLVEAGLTPYAAIEAATRNPAEYLKAQGEFGTVEVGKRADLLLVEANPLENVGNLSRRAGVMVRGRWLAESELKKMLEEVAASAQPQPAPKS